MPTNMATARNATTALAIPFPEFVGEDVRLAGDGFLSLDVDFQGQLAHLKSLEHDLGQDSPFAQLIDCPR